MQLDVGSMSVFQEYEYILIPNRSTTARYSNVRVIEIVGLPYSSEHVCMHTTRESRIIAAEVHHDPISINEWNSFFYKYSPASLRQYSEST